MWEAGVQVEVRQWEQGFEGAWFEARVVRQAGSQVLVQYSVATQGGGDDDGDGGGDGDGDGDGDSGGDGDGEALQVWAPRANLRPLPPLAPPEAGVGSGAVVGVRRLGGWWDAEVVRAGEGGKRVLRLLPGGQTCTAQAAGLRPAWAWQQGAWHVCETAAHLASHLAEGPLLSSAGILGEQAAGYEAEAEAKGMEAEVEEEAEEMEVEVEVDAKAEAEAGAATKLAVETAAANEQEEQEEEQDGPPLWAGLGCEVEVWEAVEDAGGDGGGGGQGAWWGGEVLEHLVAEAKTLGASVPLAASDAVTAPPASPAAAPAATAGTEGIPHAAMAPPSTATPTDAAAEAPHTEAQATEAQATEAQATEAQATVVEKGTEEAEEVAGVMLQSRVRCEPSPYHGTHPYIATPPYLATHPYQVRCEPSPYAPTGMLLLQLRATWAAARPRPPPPPTHFLEAARPGASLPAAPRASPSAQGACPRLLCPHLPPTPSAVPCQAMRAT